MIHGIQFCAIFFYTFRQVLSNSIVNSKSIKLWLNLISKVELVTVVSISSPWFSIMRFSFERLIWIRSMYRYIFKWLYCYLCAISLKNWWWSTLSDIHAGLPGPFIYFVIPYICSYLPCLLQVTLLLICQYPCPWSKMLKLLSFSVFLIKLTKIENFIILRLDLWFCLWKHT